jgi:hypothetical protein
MAGIEFDQGLQLPLALVHQPDPPGCWLFGAVDIRSLSQKGSGPLRVLCGVRTCDVN